LSVLDENKRKNVSFDESELLDKNLIDSAILKNSQEFYDLMSLCKFGDQKWKLIYRASRDGFRAEDFHQKCDEKFNTLVLVKSTNSNVFGGFSGRAWSSNEEHKTDELSFVFSLINPNHEKKIIEISNESKGIHCKSQMGPCFGNEHLQISNSSNLNTNSSLKIGSDFETENFQAEEIEVFAKDYNLLSQVSKSWWRLYVLFRG
jgi:hypothetical protein